MKKYIIVVVVAFIGITAIFFFFYHFGTNDSKALTDFSVAYQNYDRAVSDLSTALFTSSPGTTTSVDELEHNADQALAVLNLKSSVRISSLTKNDAEIMRLMPEIAGLTAKELIALREYSRAIDDPAADPDKIAQQLDDLTTERKASYERFLQLGR
jgi:hypothetical protein